VNDLIEVNLLAEIFHGSDIGKLSQDESERFAQRGDIAKIFFKPVFLQK